MNLGNVYEHDGFDVADNPVLVKMYGGITTNLDEYFDSLRAPSLSSLLLPQDLEDIHKVVTSVKLAGNGEKRIFAITDIMARRGFTKLAGGTNRSVYTHPNYPSIVIKVAIDNVGIRDNPAEYNNQFVIKPFCTKCFEVSADGAVGVFEKVEPIKNPVEFSNMVYDIFALSFYFVREKGILLEDFGSKFFMNWGMRDGYGPVILDYPYMYEPDPEKIYCDRPNEDGSMCNGEIDYDPDFNFLVCEKCGKRYRAIDISKVNGVSGVVSRKTLGGKRMHIKIKRGNDVIKEINAPEVRKTIGKPAISKNWKNRVKSNEATGKSGDDITIKVVRGNNVIGTYTGGVDVKKPSFDSGIIVRLTRDGKNFCKGTTTVSEEHLGTGYFISGGKIVSGENAKNEEPPKVVEEKCEDKELNSVEENLQIEDSVNVEEIVVDETINSQNYNDETHENVEEIVVNETIDIQNSNDETIESDETSESDDIMKQNLQDFLNSEIDQNVTITEETIVEEDPGMTAIKDGPTELIYPMEDVKPVKKASKSKAKTKKNVDIDADLENSNSKRPAKKQKKAKDDIVENVKTKKKPSTSSKKASTTKKIQETVVEKVIEDDPKPELDTSMDEGIMMDIVSTMDPFENPVEREDEVIKDEIAELIANKEPITPELIRNSNTKMTVEDILKNY